MIEISKMNSKKIKVITFLCAILVVFLHSYNLKRYSINSLSIGFTKMVYIIEAFISQGVARAAVPLFFIISAFLFFHNIDPNKVSFKWFIQKYKKRFKSLVIPYLIWNTISYLIYLIPALITPTRFLPKENIVRFILIDFIQGVLLFKYNAIFWFVFNLIVLITISPIIFLVLRDKLRGQIITIFVFMLWLLRTKNGNAILGSEIRLDAVSFFIMGSYVALHGETIFKKVLDKKYAIVLICFWILLLTINIMSPTKFIYKLGIFVGVTAIWYGIDLFLEKLTVTKYMNYTFIIYAMHAIILKVTSNLILKLLGKQSIFALLNYIIAPIITLIIIYMLTVRIKKHFPTTYGVINGSREKKKIKTLKE